MAEIDERPWLGDLLNNFGIDGHIQSIDIVRVAQLSHPRVTFLEGDGRALGETLTAKKLAALPRPWLIIEDADHSYETSKHVLEFFHPHLEAGEYIVVEDGIISDLSNDPACNSGPHRALKEFDQIAAGNISTSSANFVTLAKLVATAALWREESRGAHFRTDFPQPRDDWRVHSVQLLGSAVRSVRSISGAEPATASAESHQA